MHWLMNLKLKNKLIGGFILVALIAGFIGSIGYTNVHKISRADTVLYEKITVPLGELAEISITFQRTRINVRDYVNAKDAAERQTAWDTIQKLRAHTRELCDRVEKTLLTEHGKKEFAEFIEARKAYGKQIDHIKSLTEAGKLDEANVVINGDAKKTAMYEQQLLDKLMEAKIALAKQTSESNTSIATRASYLMIGLTVGGVVLALCLGILISGIIIRPVSQLASDAAKVSEGDLTVQVTSSSRDEIGLLANSFRVMTESLRSTIQQVAATSSNVSTAATQLHATAEQIATGAEEVVAQSHTVATAGEEMAATANDIANNCQSAAAGAMDASNSASNGSTVVDKTVQAMEQIARRVQETAGTVTSLGERSDQIGAIVGTIEDIADQTNLLALNAAIEAARAGEMGRGFAVVADEVRALAERTTKATKEISDMIRTIQNETRTAVSAMEEGVREVEYGTNEAAKSGQALQSIMEQVNIVSMQISQVATAAEEQTATTSEISNNMLQITDVVQQTARGAHESATAASQLSHMATDLQTLVKKFKI